MYIGSIDSEAINNALASAENCDFIIDVRQNLITKEDDGYELHAEVDFEVIIPSKFKRYKETPEGIKGIETVNFYFGEDFPNSVPKFALRKDFYENFAHISGFYREGLIPCIYEGDIEELYFQQGIKGIFFQISLWLQKAAADNLIDAKHGWQPRLHTRSSELILADEYKLCDIADNQQEMFFLKTRNYSSGLIEVLEENFDLTENNATTLFANKKIADLGYVYNSFAIPIYCRNFTDEIERENKTYRHEIIRNVYGLLRFSKRHGFLKEFVDALNVMEKQIGYCENNANIKILVIFLIKRPCKIIGSNSTIEICPYVIATNKKDLTQTKGMLAKASFAGQISPVTPRLLSKMSGLSDVGKTFSWTLIGAGSLGSKILSHLSRTGNAPEVVIDKSAMLPHNLARHVFFDFVAKKAELSCRAIQLLGQKAAYSNTDILDVLNSKESIEKHKINDSKLIVNTTASFKVRNALHKSKEVHSRVVDASLFGSGKVGALLIEGKDRNPKLNDLMAEFYKIVCDDDSLSELIFNSQDAEGKQMIGQGCGSYTVVMSDGRISITAAGISEFLLNNYDDIISTGNKGKILIGKLSNDNISIKWKEYSVPDVEVLKAKIISGSENTWELRINKKALKKIETECKRFSNVETGGILLGTISENLRTSNIVDVIDLPKDSKRSPSKLIIGTEYVRKNRDYLERTNGNIRFLGTWHSHIAPCPASQLDIDTLNEITALEQCPSISLIRRPDKYEALVAVPQFSNGDKG